MADPLSDIITLMRPQAVFTKEISGAGRWGVRYADFGHPSFAVVIEGACRLAVDGEVDLVLRSGDFVLLPATPGFTISGLAPVRPDRVDPHAAAREMQDLRHGDPQRAPDVRLLGGYFVFEGADSALLVSLLPGQIHVRGEDRFSTLVRILVEESGRDRPGRTLVLARLVEVLLVEALRHAQVQDAPPGLLSGLADPRLAEAIRRMHADPARSLTVAELAREAALSRSVFFERFSRLVGMAPMDYLLTWRMAVAKDMLRRQRIDIAEVAGRIGYGSASTFSTAFSRHVGQPPGRYARGAAP
ncbi:AraC family transcriptional regulator [Ensifer soli]|uniref:AraC family transcriptional regulator n=1 Tax=Ciceribacter sp. sgz301302 TaxID=3342379 RepID=UPI0035B8F867